jgi:hypothetical protein
MATLVTKTVVCDEGLEKCDSSTLVRVRVSVNGKSVAQLLCAKHAAPFLALQEKMSGKTTPGRAKVVTLEEVASRRKPRK